MIPSLLTCGLLLIFGAVGNDDAAKPKREDVLRQELLRMVKEDQVARKRFLQARRSDKTTSDKLAEIDRKNTTRMKEIVRRHGWPGKSLVGEDGAHAAWLLVQHADRDREFQKRCLALLKTAVQKSEVAAADLAYLTDRVRVGEKKKQIYGTQFRTVDGKMEPYPIEDEANVDRRRKEVGLSSMAEYRKQMEKLYRGKGTDKK